VTHQLAEGSLTTRAFRNARSVARDPRVAGVVRAGPRVMQFLARSKPRSARARQDDSIVVVRPTPLLATDDFAITSAAEEVSVRRHR
jgi:hypothetical protein